VFTQYKKNIKGLSSMQLVASRFVSSTLSSPYPHHSHFFDTLLLTSHKLSSLLTHEEVLMPCRRGGAAMKGCPAPGTNNKVPQIPEQAGSRKQHA
jgi:hypothetical protein